MLVILSVTYGNRVKFYDNVMSITEVRVTVVHKSCWPQQNVEKRHELATRMANT